MAISNFGYVIDGWLAGLAHPDSERDAAAVLDELHDRGIRILVSLDEVGLDPALVQAHGLQHRHIPVTDFEPPSLEQAREFAKLVSTSLEAGEPVAAHCQGGIGRTGTLIASYLISQGMTPDEASELVRAKRPSSIETDSQREFLREFAEYVDRLPRA